MEISHNCNRCGQHFKARETLAAHQVVHSEKCFKRFADVKEHEKTVTKRERSFTSELNQCESAFTTTKNSKQHHIFFHTVKKHHINTNCVERV